jgi:hypothetical protein
MSLIEAALAAIDARDPTQPLVYTQFANQFGVDRRTLARRHQRVTGSRATQYENLRAVHPQQELELVRYINQLTERGLPPTRAMIRSFGSQLAKTELGVHWVDRFLQRHDAELISRWVVGIDRARHQADSHSKYMLYFELLREKISQYNIEPGNIYNMDEKGFLLGILTRLKRVFSRQLYEDRKIRSHIQDGNREWITLVACICADGTALDPTIIYQSDSGSLQDTWLQAFDHDYHRVQFGSSSSGWSNNELGLAWLKLVFDRSTKAKAGRSYRLLILDGHGSHITMDFIEYCHHNRILIAIYPPHATHTLQPLDVVMFKPLSSAYSAQVAAFMERCQGLTNITKRDFYPMFMAAWESSFKPATILKAFKATGLSPFNPDVILKRFNPPAQSSDSDSSALSASDWRKIQQLITQATQAERDTTDRKVSKLTRTLHRVVTEAALHKNEITQLRQALANERRRRKRGKPLPLEQPEEYHGGAQIWSPSKVKAARDQILQKELAEEQLQHQKLEKAREREDQRQAKAQATQAKRQARAEAQVVRQAARAREAADRASRRAARRTQQQLQQAQKTAQIGKKRRLKASTKLALNKRVAIQREVGGEASGAPAGPPPARSRLGRAIKLPTKYQ